MTYGEQCAKVAGTHLAQSIDKEAITVERENAVYIMFVWAKLISYAQVSCCATRHRESSEVGIVWESVCHWAGDHRQCRKEELGRV